jgi:hypothetical protein
MDDRVEIRRGPAQFPAQIAKGLTAPDPKHQFEFLGRQVDLVRWVIRDPERHSVVGVEIKNAPRLVRPADRLIDQRLHLEVERLLSRGERRLLEERERAFLSAEYVEDRFFHAERASIRFRPGDLSVMDEDSRAAARHLADQRSRVTVLRKKRKELRRRKDPKFTLQNDWHAAKFIGKRAARWSRISGRIILRLSDGGLPHFDAHPRNWVTVSSMALRTASSLESLGRHPSDCMRVVSRRT